MSDDDINTEIPSRCPTPFGVCGCGSILVFLIPVQLFSSALRKITKRPEYDDYWYEEQIDRFLEKLTDIDLLRRLSVSRDEIKEIEEYTYCKWCIKFYHMFGKYTMKKGHDCSDDLKELQDIMDTRYEEYMIIHLAGLE